MAEPAFGARLRRLRRSAGLTIEELSAASGVSERTIGNMERGASRRPQRGTVGLIADALRLTGADRADLLAAARAGRREQPDPASALLAMPRGVPDFTGREGERALLTGLLPAGPAGTAAVAVISGPPGVGKTSLAVHTAMELAGSPDGRLFVDLRGLDARPLDPALALERLITALDPEHPPIPSDLGGRTALYRSVAAGRWAAVVLDNAADEAQVRPLLPATGGGITLVTSRRLLTGLEGVRRVRLDPLPDTDAERLLRGLIADRPDTGDTGDPDDTGDTDRATVAGLARLCGNLPLALRIVGNRLATRPDWSPARLLSRLDDAGRRLPALVAGDLEVSAAFELSYAQLSGGARRLLRRLAVVPGADCGPALAAVLTGEPVEATEDALDELVELGLLQSGFTGRYRLHDLMRLYAAARLEQEEPAPERTAARDRAVGWLLDTAIAAGRWFEPEFGGTPGWAGSAGLDTEQRAEQWLRAEADNWLAALEIAAEAGRHRKVLAVAEAMHWFSERWIHWGHWPRVFDLSSRAALRIADDGAAATHLNYLSWACANCLGDGAAAAACARHAHRRAVAAGDLRQQGWARSYLATALLPAGEPGAALVSARQAVELFRAAGDREGLPYALAITGRSLERSGQEDAALRAYHDRLAAISDPATAPAPQVAAINRVSALFDVGRLHMRRAEWPAAVAALETALASDVAGAIPQWQAAMYVALGEAHRRLGSAADGQADLRRAEEVYRRIGDGEHAARTRDWLDRMRPLPAATG